eukprot:703308_1
MVIVPNFRLLSSVWVIVSIASGSAPGPLSSHDLSSTLPQHTSKYQSTIPSSLHDSTDRYPSPVDPILHQSTYRSLLTADSGNVDCTFLYDVCNRSGEVSRLIPRFIEHTTGHTSPYHANHIIWIFLSAFMLLFFKIRTRLSTTNPSLLIPPDDPLSIPFAATTQPSQLTLNARNITPYLPFIIYHLLIISTPHFVFSTVISQHKLTALNDASDNDRFAWGLDVYGDYALIGAYGDHSMAEQSGSVYVFQQHDDQWNLTQTLVADDGAYRDHFGRTVCVYDSYAFIAAPYDNDQGADSGSVYIFNKVNEAWTQSAKLVPDDLDSEAFFGWDIAMYDDYALIGAMYDDYVSMWDDHAIIGAYKDIDDSGNVTVSAYVYRRVNGNWSQTAKLLPSNGTTGDDMNRLPVSIYANYAVIGGSYSNSIYIFEELNGVWTETQSISGESGGDKFGKDVVMYGQYILVGAEAANDGKGKGYAFKNMNGTWSLWDTFIAADGVSLDRFAYSISVYNNVVFFGAHKKNNYQ